MRIAENTINFLNGQYIITTKRGLYIYIYILDKVLSNARVKPGKKKEMFVYKKENKLCFLLVSKCQLKRIKIVINAILETSYVNVAIRYFVEIIKITLNSHRAIQCKGILYIYI